MWIKLCNSDKQTNKRADCHIGSLWDWKDFRSCSQSHTLALLLLQWETRPCQSGTHSTRWATSLCQSFPRGRCWCGRRTSPHQRPPCSWWPGTSPLWGCCFGSGRVETTSQTLQTKTVWRERVKGLKDLSSASSKADLRVSFPTLTFQAHACTHETALTFYASRSQSNPTCHIRTIGVSFNSHITLNEP